MRVTDQEMHGSLATPTLWTSRLQRSLAELALRTKSLRARLGAKWMVALLSVPLALFGVAHFGPRAAGVLLLSLLVCSLASVVPRALSGQPYTLFNPGTVVTGMMLGLTLSDNTPFYMIVVGGLVAEMVGKAPFPGLGRALFNPAALGRGVIAILEVIDPYPIADVVTSSSPLMVIAGGHASPSVFADLLLGLTKGAIGETSRLLLILVGIPMLLWVVRKREAALGLILSVPLWVAIMPSSAAVTGHAPWVLNPFVYLLGGSTLLMALFFCTDPMTTPRTAVGGWVFGASAGLVGVLGRLYTTIPGCEMWGVLIMNMCTPAIDHYVERSRGRISRALYRAPVGRREVPVASFYANVPAIKRLISLTHQHEPISAMRAGMSTGSYLVFAKLLKTSTPAEVIKEVEQGGLGGCGGAHFPVATKWQFARRYPGPRVLVVNGQEGEYESIKDHFLMSRDPHLVIEGAAIAAFAIEAAHVYLVVDPHADAEFAALERALADLRRTLERLPFELHLVRGPGLFVIGEETALLEFLEGKRGEPRLRPPFPAEKGLFGQPTVVQNVETVSWLPSLIHGGGAAFKQAGPLKLVSVLGAVAEPGVYAVPIGTSLAKIVQIAGGVAPGKTLLAYGVGGPSGGFLPADAGDTPLSEPALMRAGAMLGTASVRVLHTGECLVQEGLKAIRFFEQESCGRCTPCRVGTTVLRRLTEELVAGGRGPELLKQVDDVSLALYQGSFCGLGRGVPNRLRSVTRYWPEVVEAHLKGSGCPICDA